MFRSQRLPRSCSVTQPRKPTSFSLFDRVTRMAIMDGGPACVDRCSDVLFRIVHEQEGRGGFAKLQAYLSDGKNPATASARRVRARRICARNGPPVHRFPHVCDAIPLLISVEITGMSVPFQVAHKPKQISVDDMFPFEPRMQKIRCRRPPSDAGKYRNKHFF